MPELLETGQSDYSFEIVDEVKEKMSNAENLHALIAEESVQDLQKVELRHRPYRFVKRLLDLLVALIAFVVFLVPMILVALVVLVDDPGTPVFAQYRVGRYGKRFKLYNSAP